MSTEPKPPALTEKTNLLHRSMVLLFFHCFHSWGDLICPECLITGKVRSYKKNPYFFPGEKMEGARHQLFIDFQKLLTCLAHEVKLFFVCVIFFHCVWSSPSSSPRSPYRLIVSFHPCVSIDLVFLPDQFSLPVPFLTTATHVLYPTPACLSNGLLFASLWPLALAFVSCSLYCLLPNQLTLKPYSPWKVRGSSFVSITDNERSAMLHWQYYWCNAAFSCRVFAVN